MVHGSIGLSSESTRWSILKQRSHSRKEEIGLSMPTPANCRTSSVPDISEGQARPAVVTPFYE